MKRFLQNVLLTILSIFATLTVMELILPYLHLFQIEEAVYQVRRPVVQYMYGDPHPTLRYILEKHLDNIHISYEDKLDYHVSTNSEGFRGPEWDLSRERRNIVLLGDSFAFGWGVEWEDTAGQQLERRLQSIDPRFQVINLAQSGYSIKEILNVFDHYRDRLRPEATIYLFCPNDLGGMTAEDRAGDIEIAFHPTPDTDKEFSPESKIKNHPDYWSLDKFRRGCYLHAFYARYVRPIISTRIRTSLHTDTPPPGYDFLPALPSPPVPPDTPENRFLQFSLQHLAEANPGPLYLLPTSDKTILYRQDTAENSRWGLNDFATRSEKTTFIDFESKVRATPDGGKYYFKYDDHWTVEGQSLVARMLFDAMRDNIAPSEPEPGQ